MAAVQPSPDFPIGGGNGRGHRSSSHAAELVACHGVNACKGHSACATANSACAGQNACKGQGFVMMSDEACGQVGGKT